MLPYWLTIYSLRVLFRLLTRFRVQGISNIPQDGSFLLVSNHISHFDPPVLSAACSRAIDWMGAELLFRSRLGSVYFSSVNVIKVRQYEADQNALREAIRRIRTGRCVGIFPEGGIRAGKKSILNSPDKIYDGAFMIAALSQTPILPCLVIGSDRLYNPGSLWKRIPIWVSFGDPISVHGKGREEIHRLRIQTLQSIRQLAADLKATGSLNESDWPQTPQERNPKIPPPQDL